jgi:hypothetical protein
MDKIQIISTDNNIIIKKCNDSYYSIEFQSVYNSLSNFLVVINNKNMGNLLYELNKDLIKEYKKIDEYELLIFDNISNDLDNNYYLYFKYDIEIINDLIILKLILKKLDENYYENIEFESINIYICINKNNDYINFKCDIIFKNILSQFKIDIIMLLLKKIFFRLNNYVKIK